MNQATDSGELEEQLAKCTAKMKETESDSQTRLDKLRDLKHVLAEAGETVGESNPFTQLTLPGLVTKTESMLKTFLDKADVLNGRIAAKKGMEITPAQLEELKQSFNFFDKHHRGGLDMTEFAQCQESLGQELPESQLKEVFDKHSTDGFVSFNQFLTYMQTIMRVTDSYEDILQALQSVNGDTIPPPGLAALLSPEVAAYIIPLAPKSNCERMFCPTTSHALVLQTTVATLWSRNCWPWFLTSPSRCPSFSSPLPSSHRIHSGK